MSISGYLLSATHLAVSPGWPASLSLSSLNLRPSLSEDHYHYALRNANVLQQFTVLLFPKIPSMLLKITSMVSVLLEGA